MIWGGQNGVKKKTLILLILLIPLVSSLNITETRIETTNSDYIVFINSSIILDSARVTINSIEFYNITSTGIFTNMDYSNDTILSFYGLTDPNNDFSWGNGTKFLFGQTDVNITIPPYHYLVLGDFADPIPKGAGGSGLNIGSFGLNKTICNYTYDNLLKYENISSLSMEILRDTLYENNITINVITLRNKYAVPFQGKCSELINRTLKPEFVCLSIEDYITNLNKTINDHEKSKLKDDIDSVIPITLNLLTYYIENFNDVCKEFYKKPLSVVGVEEESNIFLILLFIFLIGGLIIFGIIKKKRILLLFKIKDRDSS